MVGAGKPFVELSISLLEVCEILMALLVNPTTVVLGILFSVLRLGADEE